MAKSHKDSHIGVTGGRRVNIDDLAKDSETRKKLQDLLGLMNDIERLRTVIDSGATDAGPDTPKQVEAA